MALIVSANWNNGSNAGIWARNWNNTRGNSNWNVGCRADSALPRSRHWHGGAEGEDFRPWAKSLCRPLFGRRARPLEDQRCGS